MNISFDKIKSVCNQVRLKEIVFMNNTILYKIASKHWLNSTGTKIGFVDKFS